MTDHNCSGCPKCNAEMAAIPTMTAAQYATWCMKNSAETQRSLGMRTAGMRTAAKPGGIPHDSSDVQSSHDFHHEGHDQTVALGATCPGFDTDDEDEDDPKAASSYFRTAARKSLPRRACDVNIPNPYAAATRHAAEWAEATAPNIQTSYRAHGTPPNGHAIGLVARKLKENAEATPPPAVIRGAHGIPDPYKTALARRSS